LHQTRFADARLAADQRRAAVTSGGAVEKVVEPPDFVFATNEEPAACEGLHLDCSIARPRNRAIRLKLL